MSEMLLDPGHASPIAPGPSWYEATCGARPAYRRLEGERACDVAVVGGGFCGLTAALTLAEAGTDVVLLEAERLGDGASGRNGGQMGRGPRAGVLELEAELGRERAAALWNMAEDARRELMALAQRHGIDMDYRPGQLTPMHRARYEREMRDEVEAQATRYGNDAVEWLDRDAMATALGSPSYFGGPRDAGTGHIHPLKLVIGLGRAAAEAGATILERSGVTGIAREGTRYRLTTAAGSVTAERVLVALNGYHGDLTPGLARHVLPIQSFIGATGPLPADTDVLPGFEAVDDSRFVVRYFRKSADNRLLFGGREAYGKATPGDIARVIGKQIAHVYPQLAGVPLTHAWGGNVAITMPRHPYVREPQPGMLEAAGFSGHGVMLAGHTGRLAARYLAGDTEPLRPLKEMAIPAFPGGTLLRNPLKVLALTWYAMLDRI